MPVLLAAQGEGVAQQAGVLNIGLEGAMLAASYFAMDIARRTGNPWVGLVGGVLAAVAVSLIFGGFTISGRQDPVVTGTAINLGVLGLTSYLFQSTFGQSGALVNVHTLPRLWGDVDPLMIFMFASVPLLGYLLWRSNLGLLLRASGRFSKAVQVAGRSPARYRYLALIIGGVYAGLGGAALSLVVTGSFNENMTAGRGFIAIALVTFGRWKQAGIFAAALLIGFAEALQFYFQSLGSKIPAQLFVAMPYLVALVILALAKNQSEAPEQLGTPLP